MLFDFKVKRVLKMINKNLNKTNLIVDYLSKSKCSFKRNLELKYITYFKYGGGVDFFITPSSVSCLEKLVCYFRKSGIDFKVVGNTSNLIFLNEAYYSVIISTLNVNSISVRNDIIECESGAMIEDLVRIAILNGSIGYEGLEGIPGTVSGGIFMNAGAYGYSISTHLFEVKVIDESGNIIHFGNSECDFSRRNSIFKTRPDLIIISASFRIESEGFNYDDSIRDVEVFHIARHKYQEFVLPNLGSLFTLNSCLYRHIFNTSLVRSFKFLIVRLFFTNKIIKLFNNKYPSNVRLNDLAREFEDLSYPLSNKSLNILVNNGRVTDIDILTHIHKMKELTFGIGELENEIVLQSLIDIDLEILDKARKAR